MPIWDRDWYRNWFFKGKHAPSCTCVDCVNKRLGKKKSQKNIPKESIPAKSERVMPLQPEQSTPVKRKTVSNKKDKRNITPVLPFLLIFALSIIGLSIRMLCGSIIPFWLLLGFSVFYSIERWLIYYTRKYRNIGKLYRLLLNLWSEPLKLDTMG